MPASPAPAVDDDDPGHPLALARVVLGLERFHAIGGTTIDWLEGPEIEPLRAAIGACFRAIPRAERAPRRPYVVRVGEARSSASSRRGPGAPEEVEDARFTACVVAALPTLAELARETDERSPPPRGTMPASAYEAVAYTHSADDAYHGTVRFRH